MAGDGGEANVADDKWRIVSKGQGVLCTGCLTQILHRTVRPLPPLQALKDLKEDRLIGKLDKAKRLFFEEELAGMPDPDDPVHTAAYMNRKDPYALGRLNIHPENVKPPKALPLKSAAEVDLSGFPSPGTTTKSSQWPRISAP